MARKRVVKEHLLLLLLFLLQNGSLTGQPGRYLAERVSRFKLKNMFRVAHL